MNAKEQIKIDCNKIERFCWVIKSVITNFADMNGGNWFTLEVHGIDAYQFMLRDIRTYICTNGFCLNYHRRAHKRISDFNWNKLCKGDHKYLNTVIEIAKEFTLKLDQRSDLLSDCKYCLDTRLDHYKHIHFVKESTDDGNVSVTYKPIETVFSTISSLAASNGARMTPASQTTATASKSNSYRMTYGDINYLGSNKALLYFDRGFKGKQTFVNSPSSLELQPKGKDIVIVDEVVFTSDCICDSLKQHEQMFPHYRVTCAKGLTCPARLNNQERYARDKNATTEPTTARQALSRIWI